ncbi:MAG: hypothetical protein IJU45_06425 [Clostridia bacterium]|nr:hypothetical protein [Clostridia bacterium]
MIVYDKPDLKIALFTAEDAILAESISASGSPNDDDDQSPTPGFETLSDAIDILFGD